MQGSPTPISTNILSPVEKILASAVQSRWFSISLGALAVAFIATLAAATLLANSALSPDTVSLLRTTLGAAILVTLAFYLIGSRIRIGQMQARAHAWERSLESMNVGIALYDREDRLLNCNAAFRALYPEVAHLLVPGARFYDVATEYYKLAPADVIDGQSLEQYLAEVGRRRSGSEVTEVDPPSSRSLAVDDRLPHGRRRDHQLPARGDRAKADRARVVQAPEVDRRSG